MKIKTKDEIFIEAVKASKNIAEVLTAIGIGANGNYYGSCRNKIKRMDLDTSHFTKTTTKKPREVKDLKSLLILSENYYCTSRLKKRLLNEKLLENICVICKNTGEWQNKRLVLHLDHVNGNNKDNRLENLRLLCPNCHSQTETYCAKKDKESIFENNCENCKKVIAVDKRYCKTCFSIRNVNNPTVSAYANVNYFCKNNCGQRCSIKDSYCLKCAPQFTVVPHPTKITWPDKETLRTLVWEKPSQQLSKELGVSDKAIEKHCKKYGIEKPPRGYWQIKKANESIK
jgi:hypothetical protein